MTTMNAFKLWRLVLNELGQSDAFVFDIPQYAREALENAEVKIEEKILNVELTVKNEQGRKWLLSNAAQQQRQAIENIVKDVSNKTIDRVEYVPLEDLAVTRDAQNDSLSPEQRTWKTILNALQREMPRASFDTWLRDTEALSWRDTVLTVGVRNAYARDWLESRCESAINRLLTNAINVKDAVVKFVVADICDQVGAEYGDDPGDATNNDDERGSFTAEIVDPTRYHDEVHPERIVMLEGYALRLIEHGDMTPKEMSLWVGFRQAVYQRWKQGNGTVKNIPYWEALRFAMMSKASYFREIAGKDSIAGGLVEVVPVPATWLGTGDPRFDNAKRYRVHMSPRLTQRDCAVLESILTGEICMVATKTEARAVALKTLNDLAERDPSEYLNQSVEIGETCPRSVQEIVRRALGIKGDIPGDLHDAAERVYNRIVNAFGKVIITHYFLQTAAPKLGLKHPQAWAIIALRDRCWYDYETHTQKDFAVLQGGLEELGRWVGVDRKTVKRWLKSPGFSTFVKIANMAIPETWNTHTTILSVRHDEPLELDKVSHAIGQSEPRDWTKCVTESDKVSHAIGQSEPRLNNLYKPLLNPNKPQESPSDASKPKTKPKGGMGKQAFWDFDFLTDNNAVNFGSKKNILRANKSFERDIATLSQNFVSWILYAYSPLGVRIKDPVSLAVKRLVGENPNSNAGGDFAKLAKLPPFALRSLFDADMGGKELGDTLEANIYLVNFRDLEKPYKQQLYRRLFGDS